MDVEYADPQILQQVRDAMSNCEDNGFWNETVALGAVGLRDDLIENDAVIEGVDPEKLLVAVKAFLASHDLPLEPQHSRTDLK